MKRYFFAFLLLCLNLEFLQAQQMPLPAPNESNVLFIKHVKNITSTNTLVSDKDEVRIRSNGQNWEWTDSYMFFSHDTRGNSIDYEFYTPNKEYFGYTPIAPYNNVSITYTQLRDILATKTAAGKIDYLKGFSHIYIIDLDFTDPRRSNYYKIIEVKPYFDWEH